MLTKKQFEAEKDYRILAYFVEDMMENGILTKKEASRMKAQLLREISPVISSI